MEESKKKFRVYNVAIINGQEYMIYRMKSFPALKHPIDAPENTEYNKETLFQHFKKISISTTEFQRKNDENKKKKRKPSLNGETK